MLTSLDGLLTRIEAAKYCGVSTRTIRHWTRQGIGGVKLEIADRCGDYPGAQVLYDKDAVKTFVRRTKRLRAFRAITRELATAS